MEKENEMQKSQNVYKICGNRNVALCHIQDKPQQDQSSYPKVPEFIWTSKQLNLPTTLQYTDAYAL